MKSFLPIALLLILPASVSAAERNASKQVCAEDLPEGAHVSTLPSCGRAAAPKPRGDGFRDLGNGTSVRIGGRVGAEYGVGR